MVGKPEIIRFIGRVARCRRFFRCSLAASNSDPAQPKSSGGVARTIIMRRFCVPNTWVLCVELLTLFFSSSSPCYLPPSKALKLILDILYQYAIVWSLNRHDFSVPANNARPPRSPSIFSKIFPSDAITFSPTLRFPKSFRCNAYGNPRKCCKQKTYAPAKRFGCNTYKKLGEGRRSRSAKHRNKPIRYLHSRPFFSCACEMPIFQPLCFHGLPLNGGCYPPTRPSALLQQAWL